MLFRSRSVDGSPVRRHPAVGGRGPADDAGGGGRGLVLCFVQNLNYKDFKDQIKKSSTLKIERRIYIVGGILMVVAVWIIYFYSIINYESFVIKKYMLTTSGVLIAGLAIIGMCGIIYNKRKQTRTKEEKTYFSKIFRRNDPF